MADEATLKRWATDHILDAAKDVNADCLHSAMNNLGHVKKWLEQAIEAKTKREADEEAARVLAAYTDLADAA